MSITSFPFGIGVKLNKQRSVFRTIEPILIFLVSKFCFFQRSIMYFVRINGGLKIHNWGFERLKIFLKLLIFLKLVLDT